MLNFENLPMINLELFGPVNMYVALGVEVATAILLGGFIGMDREKKLKSAGMKTHILICLGAMLYTAVSHLTSMPHGSGYVGDVNRVSAQVVSGIGFLGAGAIIQSQKGVFGLTTAATIWVVAAIGVAIGSGYAISATLYTVTTLVVLKLIDPIYRLMTGKSYFHLEIVGTGEAIPNFEHFMLGEEFVVKHQETFHEQATDKYIIHYYLKINPKDLSSLVYKIRNLETIKNVNYRQVADFPYHEED